MVGRWAPPYTIQDGTQVTSIRPRYLTWDDSVPVPPAVVVLATKWRQMSQAVAWIRRWAPQSFVLSIMNGMGQEEALADLPDVKLGIGTTTAAVTRQESAIHIKSHGETLLPQIEDRRLAVLAGLDGIRWMSPETMRALRWQKLLQNSVINPLTALANCRNGELPHQPLWQLRSPLLQEGLAVARADGVSVPDDMAARVEALCRATGDNISSMLQDVRAGLPTEIAAINGFLVQRGAVLGIPTPTHRALCRLVETMAR